MSLPKLQSSYTYEMTLPVSGSKHKYRPYLVKEEKALLMANEAGKPEDIANAMVSILDSCVEGLQAENLPLADLEYAFVMVRSRSAGENIDIYVPCDKCEEDVKLNVNMLELETTKVPDGEGEAPDYFEINTPDGVWGIKMRYPTYGAVAAASASESEVDSIFGIMAEMLDTLSTQERVFNFKEESLEDRKEFLESLSSSDLESIQKFMDQMPVTKLDLKFTCPHCQAENEQELKGLQNFFA